MGEVHSGALNRIDTIAGVSRFDAWEGCWMLELKSIFMQKRLAFPGLHLLISYQTFYANCSLILELPFLSIVFQQQAYS